MIEFDEGTVINGQYRIEKMLGRGGMGVVYKASDLHLGEDAYFALKFLDIRADGGNDDDTDDEDTLDRFAREIKTISHPKFSHPNIVRGIAYDVTPEGYPFYVMDFYPSAPVHRYAAKRGGLQPAELRDAMEGIARALDHLHKLKVVHRDLKPDNLLMGESGCKLSDFGTLKVEAANHTVAGAFIGSPSYSSPEQVRALEGGPDEVDQRTDIYLYGASFFELVTGKRPHTGSDVHSVFRKILSETPAEPAAINPSIGPTLNALLLRCLAKNKEDRFAHGGELAEAVRDVPRAEWEAVAWPHFAQKQTLGADEILQRMRKTDTAPTKKVMPPPAKPPSAPSFDDDGSTRKVSKPVVDGQALLATRAVSKPVASPSATLTAQPPPAKAPAHPMRKGRILLVVVALIGLGTLAAGGVAFGTRPGRVLLRRLGVLEHAVAARWKVHMRPAAGETTELGWALDRVAAKVDDPEGAIADEVAFGTLIRGPLTSILSAEFSRAVPSGPLGAWLWENKGRLFAVRDDDLVLTPDAAVLLERYAAEAMLRHALDVGAAGADGAALSDASRFAERVATPSYATLPGSLALTYAPSRWTRLLSRGQPQLFAPDTAGAIAVTPDGGKAFVERALAEREVVRAMERAVTRSTDKALHDTTEFPILAARILETVPAADRAGVSPEEWERFLHTAEPAVLDTAKGHVTLAPGGASAALSFLEDRADEQATWNKLAGVVDAAVLNDDEAFRTTVSVPFYASLPTATAARIPIDDFHSFLFEHRNDIFTVADGKLLLTAGGAAVIRKFLNERLAAPLPATPMQADVKPAAGRKPAATRAPKSSGDDSAEYWMPEGHSKKGGMVVARDNSVKAPASSAAGRIGVPYGVKFYGKLTNDGSASLGQPVEVELPKDLRVTKTVTFPHHTRLLGAVSDLTATGRLTITFHTIAFPDGRSVSFRGSAILGSIVAGTPTTVFVQEGF